MKALLYCVKSKPYLSREMIDKPFIEVEFCLNARQDINHNRVLNGKIVAEVEINKVEEIILNGDEIKCKYGTRSLFSIEEESCLTFDALDYYLNVDKPYGFALHLTNLKVFDSPKELNDYYLFDPDYCILKELKKAPQNMCRVVGSYGLIEVPSKEYILISIQPQHLCKILNGEKTIEVRRKVLNCLRGLKDDE